MARDLAQWQEESFAVKPNDTIGFYRELAWVNAITNQMILLNRYAFDTLGTLVYPVNVADGSPLGRPASIGMCPSLAPGMPRIYGQCLIIVLVFYMILPSIDVDSALVGITVRVQGAGHYHLSLCLSLGFCPAAPCVVTARSGKLNGGQRTWRSVRPIPCTGCGMPGVCQE